ncbi:hypothetical protein BaRGS_00025914 [Batillaria attramentaria]|uniref:Uncharacterized protein n=1 Tax=Batillaria attramentaria TaxID=370345 RepID=A0ABD0K7J6_9CAEN
MYASVVVSVSTYLDKTRETPDTANRRQGNVSNSQSKLHGDKQCCSPPENTDPEASLIPSSLTTRPPIIPLPHSTSFIRAGVGGAGRGEAGSMHYPTDASLKTWTDFEGPFPRNFVAFTVRLRSSLSLALSLLLRADFTLQRTCFQFRASRAQSLRLEARNR